MGNSRVVRGRHTLVVAAFAFVALASNAEADDVAHPWQVAIAGGGEVWRAPHSGGNGFFLVDASRAAPRGSRLHFLYNTDTLLVGLEGARFADGKLELSIVAKGEALFAGLLFNYYQGGDRNQSRAFFASYAQLLPSLKWHPAARHTLELVVGMRQWFFRKRSQTADTFVLPENTFVFEPRLGYTFWGIHADAREWEAHRLFPRITGFAFGLTLGLDRRTRERPWGADFGGGQLDPRNRPGVVIFTLRQWMAVGANLGTWGRIQLEEHASYGHGEDDLTRNRVGGMNPYVLSIAGLPWAALLSERLVSAQASLHVKVGQRGAHELGVALNGGAFNDVRRVGRLTSYGGAGGVFVFADLRPGRVQIHLRAGYAFPAPFQLDPPHFAALVTVGSRVR